MFFLRSWLFFSYRTCIWERESHQSPFWDGAASLCCFALFCSSAVVTVAPRWWCEDEKSEHPEPRRPRGLFTSLKSNSCFPDVESPCICQVVMVRTFLNKMALKSVVVNTPAAAVGNSLDEENLDLLLCYSKERCLLVLGLSLHLSSSRLNILQPLPQCTTVNHKKEKYFSSWMLLLQQ